MTRPLPDHGTLSRYKHYGCRCAPCADNFRAYQRTRYRLRGYGTWQPLAPAQPVREHLTGLMAAGYTLRSVAEATEVEIATLSRVLYYGSKSLRTEAANRVLAVTVDDLTLSDHRAVDGTGTRRRLQALVAIGWPLSHVARHLDMHPRRMTDLVRAERVSVTNAQRVATGYRRLCAMTPADHGVPRPQITTALRLAASRGWHGPLAWDDIDNPNEEPDLGDAAETPRHLALAEDGLWLERTQGYTRQQAADRLGVKRENLQAAICRARRAQPEQFEEAA